MTVADYLYEHPFHDYMYMYNNGIYHTPEKLLNKYIERVECDGLRYVIYVADVVYYNETYTPMQIQFQPNKNIIDAKNNALNVILSLNGIECINNVIYVHTRKKTYTYELCCKKLLSQNEWLPYLKRV